MLKQLTRGKEMSDVKLSDYKDYECDCNGEGCEKCTCENCGDWLFKWEETKCQDCIDMENDL